MKLQLLFLTLGNQTVNHFEFIVPRAYKADGPAYLEALIYVWEFFMHIGLHSVFSVVFLFSEAK